MLISIIIPTCKDYKDVERQIFEITRTWDWEQPYELIPTCEKVSAAINRNIGLNLSKGEICIQIDDDITGFYPGWGKDLIAPLLVDESIFIVSARLMDKNGSFAFMMGDSKDYIKDYVICQKVPTACIAHRKMSIRYDENFIGSGFEDDDMLLAFKCSYPDKKIAINNKCRLVHNNEQKNQGGKNWVHNKSYFLSKHPEIKDTWHD